MILGFKTQFIPKILDGTKIHTIRVDAHDRWKPGMKIQFATGVRTSYYNQFHEAECASVQRITFARPAIGFPSGKIIEPTKPNIYVDGLWILRPTIRLTLAKNDGFDSEEELLTWFDTKAYLGKPLKLIHWTTLKY